MPYNLLFLPLLGGYIFVRKCFRTRYRALRAEHYKLLFLAAEFGVYLLLLAAAIRYMSIRWNIPLFSSIGRLWHRVIPFEYGGTAFLALFLGCTLCYVVNLGFWCFGRGREFEVDRAIKSKGDPLEVLLKDAMRLAKAVLITLKSGKVYVGQVITNFNPAYEMQSVKISPILSGYRDSDDQTVIFNIDYTDLLSMIDSNDPSVSEKDMGDLGIVIPLDEITSACIFSLPMYKRFFAHHLLHKD
jgi:hypothetical protein